MHPQLVRDRAGEGERKRMFFASSSPSFERDSFLIFFASHSHSLPFFLLTAARNWRNISPLCKKSLGIPRLSSRKLAEFSFKLENKERPGNGTWLHFHRTQINPSWNPMRSRINHPPRLMCLCIVYPWPLLPHIPCVIHFRRHPSNKNNQE